MIVSIGIDSVEINRFSKWHSYDEKKLLRVFSLDEIAYAKSVQAKSAERFAVRFAVKEAFFKATSGLSENPLPLLKLFKHVELTGAHQKPLLTVNWKTLSLPTLKVLVSATHTSKIATAFVILEK